MSAGLGFENYGFTYSGSDRPALADVTLEVPAARVVSVISAQGAGKTTLLRAAAGLLGEIYQGVATGRIERASAVRPGAFFDGYVQVTLAVETVREEIGLPLYAAGISRAERETRVAAVARELRIENLLDRNVTALSGGEEKLVGIAAALVPESPVHVLDEPFEQLDVAHFAAVVRAAKNRARRGSLVLIGTGSVDTALNIADAALLFDGDAWRFIDAPDYDDVTSTPGLESSTVAKFLTGRGANASGVRRFRDGVVKVS
jgi:energy-coupling factor transport system ATP-binding protein